MFRGTQTYLWRKSYIRSFFKYNLMTDNCQRPTCEGEAESVLVLFYCQLDDLSVQLLPVLLLRHILVIRAILAILALSRHLKAIKPGVEEMWTFRKHLYNFSYNKKKV